MDEESGMESSSERGENIVPGVIIKTRHSDPVSPEQTPPLSEAETEGNTDPPSHPPSPPPTLPIFPQGKNQWIIEQRRNRRYCDIIIHATILPEPAGPDPDSEPIHAHKIILGNVSPFFAHALSASDESMHEFIINGIDRPTLEYLINYIYMEEMEPLSEASVFMIYTGAQMLLLQSVMNECIRFIRSTTTVANAVINWVFGEIHSEELHNFASGFILKNLEEVCKTESFCSLTSDKVKNLIRIGIDSKKCSAEDLLVAAISWLKYNTNDRSSIITDILREIPLQEIELESLQRWFRKDEVVGTIDSCKELYFEVIENIAFDQKRREKEAGTPLKAEPLVGVDKSEPVGDNTSDCSTATAETGESSPSNEDNGDSSSRTSMDCRPDSTESLPNPENPEPMSTSVPSGPSGEAKRVRPRTGSVGPTSPVKKLILTPSKRKGKKSSFSKTKSKHSSRRSDPLPDDQMPCSSSTTVQRISPSRLIIKLHSAHGHNRNPLMYFICGEKQSPRRKIMFYDFKTQSYDKLTSYPFTTERSCMVYHRGSIYDIGGRANDKAFIRVKIFDFATGEWRKNPIPTLVENRSDFNCAVLNDCIYAVGGFDSYGGINCVERLPPPVKDKPWLWEEVEYMLRARDNCGVCACEGKIYAVGGFVADSDKFGAQMVIGDSVECYDPAVDAPWTFKAPLPTKRVGLAVTVVDGLLYAMGGGSTTEDPFIKLNIVEVYDSERDSWRPRAPMNKARQFFSVVVVDDYIYALGGDSDEQPTMERFDTASNEWTMVGNLRPDGNYRSVAFKAGD